MDIANSCVRFSPNSLGRQDNRRIPIRQRILHPTMVGYINVDDCSNSDPGQTGSISPYCDMSSLYFDDSLYENEMHYKIAKYLDEMNQDDGMDEVTIHCDTEEEYNQALDTLCRACYGKFKMYSVPDNPMEIIVEKDPRDKYRVFDEEKFVNDEKVE